MSLRDNTIGVNKDSQSRIRVASSCTTDMNLFIYVLCHTTKDSSSLIRNFFRFEFDQDMCMKAKSNNPFMKHSHHSIQNEKVQQVGEQN